MCMKYFGVLALALLAGWLRYPAAARSGQCCQQGSSDGQDEKY
ncbi:hypothetical protein ALQ25_04405 [Pseudomonas coronafaciens pv. atropurpurea]|nr:hypothetical protein ALQ25_04405 [Pseudomonas coronafaciens pv. atropurpurea]